MAAALEGRIATPVFAIVPVWEAIAPASRSVATDEARKRVVHYQQDMVLHRPIEAGMRLVSRATPAALLARPNGSSLVIRTETRTEDGELVNEQYVTEFFRGVEAAESVGDPQPDHRLDRRCRETAPIGEIAYRSQTTRRTGTPRPPATTSRSISTTRRRSGSGFPAGSSTGSARSPSRPAPSARRPASTIRAPSAGSRCASRRRCSRASELTTRVWGAGGGYGFEVARRRRHRRPQGRPGGAAMSIDLSQVVAIDVHIHAEIGRGGEDGLRPEWREAAEPLLPRTSRSRPSTDMVDYYRERKMMAVVFTVDATTAMGVPPVPNDEIAEAAADNPDALIAFGSVDPHMGRVAVERGAPAHQRVRRQGLQVPPDRAGVLPERPRGVPGVRGDRRARADRPVPHRSDGNRRQPARRWRHQAEVLEPDVIDDVAADFPGLKIILAHPSFPWQDEALSVATHKQDVYIDLSGWSPKYFPANLVRYANSILQDKVLFGSDFPLITPERWMADFDTLEIKDSVKPKIMKLNAVRLLGLG